MAPIVSIVDVYKEYSLGKTLVPALRGVSLEVAAASSSPSPARRAAARPRCST